MYKYQFVSTIEDLLDAEDADTQERTGLRKSLRWVVAVFGANGFFISLSCLRSGLGWPSIVGVLIGSYVVYYYVIASYITRHKIRQNNLPSQEVALEFGEDSLEIDILGYGTFRREWSKLLRLTDAAKGIQLYFSDGTVNWLPNRVFKDATDRQALIEFLRNRKEQ